MHLRKSVPRNKCNNKSDFVSCVWVLDGPGGEKVTSQRGDPLVGVGGNVRVFGQ